ncbi:MAG: hypothetical protein ACP5NQ_08150 [Vulcanisaeta sp.]
MSVFPFGNIVEVRPVLVWCSDYAVVNVLVQCHDSGRCIGRG